MMPKAKYKSWIVIDHPAQFLVAFNLSIFLAKEYGYRGKLLIFKHDYWRNFDLSRYKHYFSGIFWFDRLDFPPPGMNVIKQIVTSLLLVPQLLVLNLRLHLLKIRKDDLVFGLSNGTFFENMIISNFPALKKIAIMGYQDYNYLLRRPNRKIFRTNIAIKITMFINSVFNMHETVFLYRRNTKVFGDGDYFLGYKEKLSMIFDAVILIFGRYRGFLKNSFKDKNVFSVRYPILSTRSSKKKTEKKIVFLGENYLTGVKMDTNLFAQETNKYLDYLRERYAKKYRLIYKPHPNETNETDYLDLTGFEIINDKRPAEIYFTENIKNIKAVFSTVSSAVTRSYYLGIDSYLFLKLLPFDKVRSSTYDTLFATLPHECFIINLKQPPNKTPNDKRHHSTGFDLTLREIIDGEKSTYSL